MEESKKYKFEYKTMYKNTAIWLCELLDDINGLYELEYDDKTHQFIFLIDYRDKKVELLLMKYSFINIED